MDKNLVSKIQTLIAESKLEEALDLFISTEQQKNQTRTNSLLLLKGKLAMLKEQELAGLLDIEELMQEKSKIAHSLLKLMTAEPELTISPYPESAKPVAPGGSWKKFLLIGTLAVICLIAGAFLAKTFSRKADKIKERQPTETTDTRINTPTEAGPASEADLKFPAMRQPFNVGDMEYRFKKVKLEKYADASEGEPAKLGLTLAFDMICKSQLGICYREEMRVVVDGKPVAPTEQKHYANWVEHNASMDDEVLFVFDAGGSNYEIVLKRDNAVWRKTFSPKKFR